MESLAAGCQTWLLFVALDVDFKMQIAQKWSKNCKICPFRSTSNRSSTQRAEATAAPLIDSPAEAGPALRPPAPLREPLPLLGSSSRATARLPVEEARIAHSMSHNMPYQQQSYQQELAQQGYHLQSPTGT